jgi:hypothetical protein
VLAAEAVHRVTHMPVTKAYYLNDTVFLFLTLLLLFGYLRRWFDESYCLLGVLSYAAVLPLTYVLFVFHPWDRLSALLWLLCIYLLRDRRMVLFTIILLVNVAVKYDCVVLPGLYFLAYAERRNWLLIGIKTLGTMALTFATYYALLRLRPGGSEPAGTIGERVVTNLQALNAYRFGFPPLLVYPIPFIAAAIAFRRADRFIQATALFGFLLLIPFALTANFSEFRAQVPAFFCVLPGALMGARILLTADTPEQARIANTAAA